MKYTLLVLLFLPSMLHAQELETPKKLNNFISIMPGVSYQASGFYYHYPAFGANFNIHPLEYGMYIHNRFGIITRLSYTRYAVNHRKLENYHLAEKVDTLNWLMYNSGKGFNMSYQTGLYYSQPVGSFLIDFSALLGLHHSKIPSYLLGGHSTTEPDKVRRVVNYGEFYETFFTPSFSIQLRKPIPEKINFGCKATISVRNNMPFIEGNAGVIYHLRRD